MELELPLHRLTGPLERVAHGPSTDIGHGADRGDSLVEEPPRLRGVLADPHREHRESQEEDEGCDVVHVEAAHRITNRELLPLGESCSNVTA